MSKTLIWLLLTIFWTTLMSFFSTQEMACISYNRLKLEAAARRGNAHAIKIKNIVENPMLLFGTTLFGVNVCLVLSSESARQLFESMQLNPTLSAIIHIPYVLILGELVPMFAARIFPEHMARLGIPILWPTSRILYPSIRLISSFFRFFKRKFQKKGLVQPLNTAMQLEELQEILQESIGNTAVAAATEFDESTNYIDSISTRIFSLREKTAVNYMVCIQDYLSIIHTASIDHALAIITHEIDIKKKSDAPSFSSECILLKNSSGKIIDAIKTEDFFHLAMNSTKMKSIADMSSQICYSPEEISLSDLFSRLRTEKVDVSFIVNKQGEISGIISLQKILTELLPTENSLKMAYDDLYIEKTASGDEKILQFLHKHGISIYSLHEMLSKELMDNQAMTFSQFYEMRLHRKPNRGDMVEIGPCLITVQETSLLGVKTVLITTKNFRRGS